MRTKDQIISMQLNELQRMERKYAVFMLANHQDVNPGFIEAHAALMRDAINAIRRTLQEVPDGA